MIRFKTPLEFRRVWTLGQSDQASLDCISHSDPSIGIKTWPSERKDANPHSESRRSRQAGVYGSDVCVWMRTGDSRPSVGRGEEIGGVKTLSGAGEIRNSGCVNLVG